MIICWYIYFLIKLFEIILKKHSISFLSIETSFKIQMNTND